MAIYRRIFFFSSTLLLVLLAWFQSGQMVMAAPRLSGSYRILEIQDLGSKIRVTLDLHFSNSGLDRVYVTQLSILSPLRPAQAAEGNSSLIIEPETGADTKQEFSVDKSEYQSWVQSSRPRLAITLQSSSGNHATITISLLPRSH